MSLGKYAIFCAAHPPDLWWCPKLVVDRNEVCSVHAHSRGLKAHRLACEFCMPSLPPGYWRQLSFSAASLSFAPLAALSCGLLPAFCERFYFAARPPLLFWVGPYRLGRCSTSPGDPTQPTLILPPARPRTPNARRCRIGDAATRIS